MEKWQNWSRLNQGQKCHSGTLQVKLLFVIRSMKLCTWIQKTEKTFCKISERVEHATMRKWRVHKTVLGIWGVRVTGLGVTAYQVVRLRCALLLVRSYLT